MKRMLIIIIGLLFIVTSSGCSSDSLRDYKKAVQKTEQLKRGRTSGEFSVAMDFNTDGMTQEDIREINYYKDMKGSFDAAYDEDLNKSIFRNYLNFGGLGFDYDLYVSGDEIFMKLPVAGKYMRINDIQDSVNKEQNTVGEFEFISKSSIDKINEIWLGLMQREDIFKGKSIALTTPDGEVKATEYTIKLNNDQIKSLMTGSIDILLKDEILKDNFEKYIKNNIKCEEAESAEELLLNIKEGIEECTIESFSYTAYVDIDGYIVNESIEVILKFENSEEVLIDNVHYKLDIKNWDINKEQEFNFPVLTEENTLNMDAVGGVPFMMEELFDIKYQEGE
ncbi:hypothetical protein OXPF_24290 [Oxobacter pfennigii]|uniref:Lipoprotein n=1 Tax=Oxobacter pfennigii TaxID=36849 RepID=A0A0P8YX06_9CLOT|nr:hypothetical protein [Oxobacter pfennigii]KPU44261.1 hypothetical protein OXPF_24290 [Oxobacter pfennigii]